MNADGSQQRRVTSDEGIQRLYPTWLHGGQRIAFVSTLNGDRDIYSITIDGTDEVNLTNNDIDENFPIASPSAPKILFMRLMGEAPARST